MTLWQILTDMPFGCFTTQICDTLEQAVLVSRACFLAGFPTAISLDRQGNLFVVIKKKAIVH